MSEKNVEEREKKEERRDENMELKEEEKSKVINSKSLQTSSESTTNQRSHRKSSALSLKSLTQKREEVSNKPKVETNLKDLPKKPFTKEELLNLWQTYINELNKKGEKLLASMLNSNIPEVHTNTLTFTLPNSRMESSLLKSKPRVLRYLREKLQNFKIDFKIIINEEFEKKFAYTPKEKYEVLLEKNPLIATLKKTFDLDV